MNAENLPLEVVDQTSPERVDRWLDAVARGFLEGPEPGGEPGQGREARRRQNAGHRLLGVWDRQAAGVSGLPVGTLADWVQPLTLAPGRSVDSLLVSDVTVAPTHRRRGIGSRLVHAALQRARDERVPVAALTATEGGIYERFGFGPATYEAELVVNRRAALMRPGETDADGGVRLVTAAELAADAPGLFERAATGHGGEVGREPEWWRLAFDPGAGTPFLRAPHESRVTRYARADGPGGRLDGYAVYRHVFRSGQRSVFPAVLAVDDFVVATADARRRLWRLLLNIDLVEEVRLPRAAVADPLQALLVDARAARIEAVRDLLWLRVVDVPSALEARGASSDGEVVLVVDDPLGIAAGTFHVRARDGCIRATPAIADDRDGTPTAPLVRLPVSELSSVLLDSARLPGLAAAGRVLGDAEGIETVRRLFAAPVEPHTSTIF